MTKISSIQALRAIAVLMIVLVHTIGIQNKYANGDVRFESILIFGLSGVDLFFVISGFVMVLVAENQPRNTTSIFNFLFSRLTRIYPVYWIYFFVVYALFAFYPSLTASNLASASFLKSFLLVPTSTPQVVAVAWTLVHEIYFYLVFSFCFLFQKKLLMSYLTIWLILVILANILLGTFFDNSLLRLVTHPLTVEFILGALFGCLYIGKSLDRLPIKYVFYC